MIDIQSLVYLLIYIPLVFAVLGLIFKLLPVNVPKEVNFLTSCIGAFASFIASFLLLQYVITYQGYVAEDNNPVITIQNIVLYFGFYLDNIALTFVFILSLMFLFVNIFSYKYILKEGQGFERFYIYLNFLQLFVLCFYISSNLIQSIVFMALGALVQYLFVNFYFQKPAAQKNSKKIFQINIMSSSFLLLATLALLYFSTLTPDTISVPTLGYNNINSLGLYSFAGLNPILFTVVCLLFIFGALIESSQFPFLSKLHLTSEAPNPVYSLFLSPVLLGGGIFLLARIFPLLNLSPFTFEILKLIGIIGALTGALTALKETETKKILGWGAVSQAGIVIMAMGFKMYAASIFHLICSGFTLVLLSFCLDALHYCTGSQENIKFLGGIREKLPSIAYPFLIGAISLSGFTFSCFYSRAMIINILNSQGAYVYLVLILLCAFFTTFYIFRAYFRIFEGEYKGSYEVKKPSRLMNYTIYIIAFICIFAGFILNNYIPYFISLYGDSPVVQPNIYLNAAGFVICALAYYLAYKIYYTKQINSLGIRFLRKIAKSRFFMDWLADLLLENINRYAYKIFYFFEKYILGAIYGVFSMFARFISFVLNKYQSRSINSGLFCVFALFAFLSIAVVIVYFRGWQGQ